MYQSQIHPRVSILSAFLVIFSCVACSSNDAEPVYTYQISTLSLTEPDSDTDIQIPVSRIGPVGVSHSVDFSLEELTAKAGSDFTSSSGTLDFLPGQQQAIITVRISGDSDFELAEDFQITFTNKGKSFVFPISITDNDPLPDLAQDADGSFSPAEYPSMTKVWADEFDGESLNASSWNYDIGDGCAQGICGWGNEELEQYSSDTSAARLLNGRLIIKASKVGDAYRSARINSRGKREITFGRIDFRARLPKGQGIWPALWMLGSSIATKPWPACGEIDIMELVGHQPAVVHGTVHYDNSGYATSTGSTQLANGDFSDSFHVFSLIWERNRMAWYVDNKKFKEFSNNKISSWPFNEPFYLIMNLAVGGRWPGKPDQTTIFPQRMEVDYVRVFR